jgi:hypothetical protein
MAILANQKILTLDYWKTAHNLKIGDIVFDRQGKPRTVTLVQEYRAPDCYAVQFDDLLEVHGDQNLSFYIENQGYRIGLSRYKGIQKFRKALMVKSVEEITDLTLSYSVPTTNPIQLPHQNLPVPPFLFGYWFFNRRKSTRLPKKMAAPPGFSEMIHEKFRDHGYKIREHDLLPKGERMFSILPTMESHLIGVATHKIPNNYLLASEEQRIELLRGILHAKWGQFSKEKNAFRFTSTHHGIILQMQGLLESLGHRISVNHDPWKNYYCIRFRSKLKLVEGQKITSKIMVHNGRRFIKSVKKLPAQLCVHIETDGLDNSILVGEGFIPCL